MKKIFLLIILSISMLLVINYKKITSFEVKNKIYASESITLREETGFKIEDSYLTGIEEEREVSSFDLGLDTSYTTTIVNKSDTTKTSGYIFTGDKVQVKKGSTKVGEYTALILGDTNGDGKISSLDYVKIKNHIMGTQISGEVYLKSADCNSDNKISSLDYVKVKNYIMEKSSTKNTITYNANGGSGTMSKQQVTANTTTNLLRNKFTKTDSSFTGWNTKTDGSGTTYKDVSKIKITKDTTLYAQWGVSSDITATCTGEYEGGYGLAKLNVSVTKGNATNYKFLLDGKTIQNSSSSSYTADSQFTLLINPKVTITSSNGTTKTITCNVNHSDYPPYEAKGYYIRVNANKDKSDKINNPYTLNRMPYYIHIPDNISAQEKLPLIIGLHGGYGIGTCTNGDKEYVTTEASQTNQYFKSVYYSGKPEKYAINGGKDNDIKAMILTVSNNRCSWDSDMYAVVEIMYALVKTYNIDFDHIVLTGVSQGGAGTLYLGFLEEQILYKATDNNTSLSSLATKYNTTVDAIKKLNADGSKSIHYSNTSQELLQKDSITMIRAKNENDQRSLFSILVPFSPGQTNYRKAFVNVGGEGTPPHTLKAPIWVITSNDEYDKVQSFAKELVKYYSKAGDIRYTVLHGLSSPHDSDTAFFNRTASAKWLISKSYGNIKVSDNSEIATLEQQMGSNFAGVWTQ